MLADMAYVLYVQLAVIEDKQTPTGLNIVLAVGLVVKDQTIQAVTLEWVVIMVISAAFLTAIATTSM
jgi:hypothetical protein